MDVFCLEVEKTIKYCEMLPEGESVVVGVSGGPDSTALLYALQELAPKYSWQLYVAHVNHGLRPSATADAEHVRRIADELGLQFCLKNADVSTIAENKKMSLEEAGRTVRYDFFMQLASKYNARIAVGHNRDDHVETILMNFLRGSGTKGLTGIPPVRDLIVRPLINHTRKQIECYCERMGFAVRIDESNEDTSFLRNRIRHELLPYLEQFNPSLRTTLVRTGDVLRAEEQYVGNRALALAKCLVKESAEVLSVTSEGLLSIPLALQRRIVRHMFRRLSHAELGYFHTENILEAAESQSPVMLELPEGIIVYVEYGHLHMSVPDSCLRFEKPYQNIRPFEKTLELGANTVPGLHIVLRRKKVSRLPNQRMIDPRWEWEKRGRWYALMDGDAVKGDLSVRFRKPGDVFSPLGMKGTKKLKDYFIDRKVPRKIRNSIPLLADGDEIVAVIGYDIAEKVKLTEDTKYMISVVVRKD